MRELIVGIVFFVLVALLLAVTVLVNDPTALAGGPAFQMNVRFTDVAGLESGNAVWVYGTEAGRVGTIQPDGKGGVVVRLDLDYDPVLREDGDIRLQARSALGGMVVAITPGTPERPARAPGTVEGSTASSSILPKWIEELREPLTNAANNIEKVSADLAESKGMLGRLISDEELAARFDTISRDVAEVTGKLREGEGTLGKLLTDDKLHADLSDAVAGLKKLASDADGGGGALDVILHDQQLAQDLKEAGARFRSVSEKLDESDGTLGKLLNDSTLYDNLNAAAGDVKDLAADLREGRGLLGRLLYDDDLSDRVDRISKDVAQVTGQLRKGEGTLGKLIQDESLYAELRDALKSLTGGAEDARENAPILTFAGFLFSGF